MNKLDLMPQVFHWGFTVRDMDKAVATWKANGSDVIVPPTEAPGLDVICCFLKYRGTAPIELVAPANDKSMIYQVLDKTGGGLDHVCFFADDVPGQLAAYEATGAQIMVPATYNFPFDRDISFVMTPMGLMVEVVSRKAVGRRDADPLSEYFQSQRGD